LVVGAHPHIIQPVEDYKGKKIYYSLGNFVFDQYFSQGVRRGLGVLIKINQKTKKFEFEEKNFYLAMNGQTVFAENE
jgi:poly-gamma-glutamate synthesis protein (capsule biosynthesis protein)